MFKPPHSHSHRRKRKWIRMAFPWTIHASIVANAHRIGLQKQEKEWLNYRRSMMAKHFSNGQGRPRIPISNSKHVTFTSTCESTESLTTSASASGEAATCERLGTRPSKHDRNLIIDFGESPLKVIYYTYYTSFWDPRILYTAYIYIWQKWGQITVQYLQQLQWRMWYSVSQKKNAQFPQKICGIQLTLIRIRKWLLPLLCKCCAAVPGSFLKNSHRLKKFQICREDPPWYPHPKSCRRSLSLFSQVAPSISDDSMTLNSCTWTKESVNKCVNSSFLPLRFRVQKKSLGKNVEIFGSCFKELPSPTKTSSASQRTATT